ncbi:MAG: TrkA family potassium uptake protein [Planctomycetota bacterium]|jgi:trk system potassium uptake protein TrkA|nr:TrkA family potassium uptake protein [Planctomycetota bacterium]
MKRFMVIGLGRFGRRLAQALTEAGHEVIAIDKREELVEHVRDEVALAVCLDATDPEALKSQGAGDLDAAAVCIGEDFESNALTTATLKSLGVRLVISRASTEIQRRILSAIGADQVVLPEEEVADRVAAHLANPNVLEHLELAEGHSLVQIRAPADWQGRTLGEIDLRRKHEVNLVAIKRTIVSRTPEGGESVEQQVVDLPLAHTVIREGDVLVLVGSTESLANLPS